MELMALEDELAKTIASGRPVPDLDDLARRLMAQEEARKQEGPKRVFVMRPGMGLGIKKRYRLGEVIGRGGQGTVYKAIDLNLKRKVVVKCVLLQDEAMKNSFSQEASLGARLKHPHLAVVYDFGTIRDKGLIIFEYVEGRDLYAIMQMHNIKPTGSKDLYEHLRSVTAESTATAIPSSFVAYNSMILGKPLAYIHARDIFHRDIDPTNIRLDEEAFLKLLDLGIAAGERQINQELEDGIISGKVEYLPPHVTWPGKDSYDGGADVYQMFLIAYEMITGLNPQWDYRYAAEVFKQSNLNEIERNVKRILKVREMQTLPLVPPVFIANGIDPVFSDLVCKGLNGEIAEAKAVIEAMGDYIYPKGGGFGLTQPDIEKYLLYKNNMDYWKELEPGDQEQFIDRFLLPETTRGSNRDSERTIWRPFGLKPEAIKVMAQGKNPARIY